MQNYGSHVPFGSLADLKRAHKAKLMSCPDCGAGIKAGANRKRCAPCSSAHNARVHNARTNLKRHQKYQCDQA